MSFVVVDRLGFVTTIISKPLYGSTEKAHGKWVEHSAMGFIRVETLGGSDWASSRPTDSGNFNEPRMNVK